MQRLHAIVDGSVQGVGFRRWAQMRAHSLGLTGYVRNLPDGRVETVAEGDPATLGQWLSLLRDGPAHADVSDVETSFTTATGEFDDFSIRH